MPQWYLGKINQIQQLSPDVKVFGITVPSEETIRFEAGQFITLDLPISDKRQARWRSYSLANAPNELNQLELCVVHLKGGVASSYLFDAIEIGSDIKFKEPFGTFTLPNIADKDLVMVCTGTGVAPFRSMLLDIFEQNIPHRGLHLIFGCRKEEDILYRNEFEELAAKHPEFTYDIALSRENKSGFYQGYVHQIYKEQYSQFRPDVKFMLCGWTKMIDDAVAHLMIDLAYDKGQIMYELYG